MNELDPFLWQNLVVLATERERLGVAIVSSELPARCGIPSWEVMRYMDELERRMGWVTINRSDVLIPIS